jgi:hypothetical protein
LHDQVDERIEERLEARVERKCFFSLGRRSVGSSSRP